MRPRASRDLAQLGTDEFYSEVATGMRMCAFNALRLWRDAAKLLSANRPQGFTILQLFVEEEAAKFHILLDAVRCPRQPADKFSRQLGYFNNHIPKGLYATYYNDFSPAAIPEIRRYMDMERKSLYLDGPNDVDWVFKNDIERKREEAIYVDYQAYEDANENRRNWHCPDHRHLRSVWWNRRPKVLDVALALHGAGITSAAALKIVADIWTAVPMTDAIGWPAVRELNVKTLNRLEEAGLLRARPASEYRTVANDWLFPLYSIDLRPERVELKDLQDRQRNWYPDGAY